jgi:predicted DNA-binding transcriptional regulator YafY
VSRIENLKILPDKFIRDAKFSVSDWMGSAFQADRGGELTDVSIKFNAVTARYIRERNWHVSQKIEELEDGCLILHLKTGGLGEVKRWVLQYGSGAEVLSPESLRQDCIVEISNLVGVYGI